MKKAGKLLALLLSLMLIVSSLPAGALAEELTTNEETAVIGTADGTEELDAAVSNEETQNVRLEETETVDETVEEPEAQETETPQEETVEEPEAEEIETPEEETVEEPEAEEIETPEEETVEEPEAEEIEIPDEDEEVIAEVEEELVEEEIDAMNEENRVGNFTIEGIPGMPQQDVLVNGEHRVVYCMQYNYLWPRNEIVNIPFQPTIYPPKYWEASAEEMLLNESQLAVIQRVLYAGYPYDAEGLLSPLYNLEGIFADSSVAVLTQAVIWSLMAEWGIIANDHYLPSDTIETGYDAYDKAYNDLMHYAKCGSLPSYQAGFEAKINGDVIFKKSNTEEHSIWKTGLLSITNPDGFKIKYTVKLPEGVKPYNTDKEEIIGNYDFSSEKVSGYYIYGGDEFYLVYAPNSNEDDDINSIVDEFIKVNGSIKLPTGVKQYVTDDEGRGDKNDGTSNYQGDTIPFQTMLSSGIYTEDYSVETKIAVLTIEPSTSPETSPSTSPETSPSTSPETSPSTSPETSPSTSPEASPSTSPETSPSTSPGTSPSTSPETSPSTSPETSPSTSPETSPSASPEPSDDVTPTPTPEPSDDVTPTPTPEPSDDVTPTPTPEPDDDAAPTPTPEPDDDAAPTPTAEPSEDPDSPGDEGDDIDEDPDEEDNEDEETTEDEETPVPEVSPTPSASPNVTNTPVPSDDTTPTVRPSDHPETSDDFSGELWLGIMGISLLLIAFAGVLYVRKRKSR